VRRLDARIRKLAGSILVAGPQEVRELSDTASFVWDRIDGSRTIGEIGEALAAEYDVDVKTATDDVAELVGELVAVEVVTLRDTP
jgi:pyrroloquinoline quinone biosynthesis protein D